MIERTYAIDHVTQALMSRGLTCKLNVIKRVDVIDMSNVSGDLGEMKCEPARIKLKNDAVPLSITAPRRIPLPMIPKIKAQIERVEKLRVTVQEDRPTRWCTPLVPVMTFNGDVRLASTCSD